jgi:hypothetical protein
MKILYIHGLNGSLSIEKRDILQHFGKVQAPSIDYEKNPDSIISLQNQFKDAKIDLIIGSSMGGFAGYYLSKLYQVPCLLFNPALPYRSVYQNIPSTPQSNNGTINIVLGSKDDIIDPKSTLHFLGDLLMQPQNYNIHIRHDLEHRIPVHVFEEEVSNIMKILSI